MNVKQLLISGTLLLNNNNITESALKTRLLIEFLLKIDYNKIVLYYDKEVEQDIEKKYNEYIDEIINGKPIQYIINCQEFFGNKFYVDENVLIPQPDTEILVEEVLKICKDYDNNYNVLDMCTGSGAIAISIAKNSRVKVTASDISKQALSIAEINSKNNNVDINFVESDLFSNIDEKYDVIVSNPPYIETKIIKSLPKEVRYEPRIALDGGKDGLNFYRKLVKESKLFLKENGVLAVEIGYNQKDKVLELFKNENFSDIYYKKDYGNNDRVVLGRFKRGEDRWQISQKRK